MKQVPMQQPTSDSIVDTTRFKNVSLLKMPVYNKYLYLLLIIYII
jgi:hypothetical protein